MILIHKSSVFSRLSSRLRWVLIKILLGDRVKSDGRFSIGRRCRFFIGKDGWMEIGRGASIADDVELQSQKQLRIGKQFCVNRYSRLVAFESIEIGDHVTLAQFVTILDHDHGFSFSQEGLKLTGYSTAPVKIGNNVWLADKCTVLKGVTIGDNVIAGAHTLINKDVPSNCIVAGSPFRIIRHLSEE